MAEPAIEVRSDVDRPVPPGWQRMHCAEGTYYWHSATDTSQWEYPTGNPHQHNQRHNYSNVEKVDNRMVVEDDLYAEPPREDPKVLQADSHTGKKTADKRNYENVDAGGHVIQRPAAPHPPSHPPHPPSHAPHPPSHAPHPPSHPPHPPHPPTQLYRKPERSVQSPQRSGEKEQQNSKSDAKAEPVYSTAEGVENVYDQPRPSSRGNTPDYDIPRRVRSPAVDSVPSVPSRQLSSPDHGASSKQGNEVHSVPQYSVPPSRDKEMNGEFNGAKVEQTRDLQLTRPKPNVPKPYKPKSELVTQERKGKRKEAPKKPPRRAVSVDRVLTPVPDSDSLYAEPWDSKVPAKAKGLYNKLVGSDSQNDACSYHHLGTATPHGNKTHYDQLMTSSSAPCSPVAKSAQEQYNHLESKTTRNLDDKEKLRRLREEKLRNHSYEELDKEFEGEVPQVHSELCDGMKVTSGPHEYEDLSDSDMLKQDTKEVVTAEPIDEANLYEDLSDHEQFESKGSNGQEGDGEPVDNRWRGDRMKRQNFEDLEDELAWDNTPIEAALRATQSPKPSTSSSSLDCSSGGKSGQDVYAVVEQKNKKRDKMNKEKELPDGWEIVNDNDRTYYWHVPTGATQWERPSAETTQGMAQQDTEDQPPPVPVKTDGANLLLAAVQSSATDADADGNVGLASRLQELKTADMRYSPLNIGGSSPNTKLQLNTTSQLADGVQTFTAVSVGYVELEEVQLLSIKGNSTVSDAIRYVTRGITVSKEGEQVVTGQMWGQEKSLYLQLHGIILKIIDADDKKVLMTQSITGIRLFGAGKELGYHFAFVARDKATRKHRCHVFRCDVPGRTVASALEEVCHKAMKEREERKRQEQREESSHVGRRLVQLQDIGVPTQQEKKTYAATYLGRTDVPKGMGVEVVHNAIEKLKSCDPSTWQEVVIEVMPSSVRLVDQKTQQAVHEHRVSILSFLALGKDKRYCGYITSPSRDIHWCHAFASEASSGAMTRAIQDACSTRYQSVLESRQGLQQTTSEKAPSMPVTSSHNPTAAAAAAAGSMVSQMTASSLSSSGGGGGGSFTVSAAESQGETKSMKGTIRSLFTKLDPRRSNKRSVDNPTQSEVSTYLHYMGSENLRSRDLNPKEGVEGAMRRLRNSQFALACQCVVSASHVTLVDSQKRSFSKRLFPLSSIVYSEQDGDVFGFITNKDKIHVCHVFTKMGRSDIDAVFQAIQMRTRQGGNT